MVAIQLIPFLFAPINVVLKNKKIIRPSKIEQSNAFVVHIPVNILKQIFGKHISVEISFRLPVN